MAGRFEKNYLSLEGICQFRVSEGIFSLRIFIYLCLFCSTPFYFLYIFSGGSISTYDYSVELNKFLSFFFLLFVGCGTVFRLAVLLNGC